MYRTYYTVIISQPVHQRNRSEYKVHGRNVELSGRDKYYKSITKRIIEGGRRI